MSAAQKKAQNKFKEAVKLAKQLRTKNPKLSHPEAVKLAFSKLAGTSVKPVKKSVSKTPKKKVSKYTEHRDNKSHNVNIKVVSGYKVGALPIGFKGSFLGYKFQVLNQYQLDGQVTAQLVEMDPPGNLIAQLNGNPKENEIATNRLYSGALATGKDDLKYYDASDLKKVKDRIKSFVVGLNKEVANFNKGIDKKTVKKKPVKIDYKPAVKKLAVVDQIKEILKTNKKIMPGGYTLRPGTIRIGDITAANIKRLADVNNSISNFEKWKITAQDELMREKKNKDGNKTIRLSAIRKNITAIDNTLKQLKAQKRAIARAI